MVSMFRVLYDKIYWSGCPSSHSLEDAAREGVSLVINLTVKGECDYALPPGVEYIGYEIPDFSFAPVEDVYANVIVPALERLRSCEKVLIHCLGGVGRSGTTIAMLLLAYRDIDPEKALREVEIRGGGPESPAQKLAFRWFARAYGLVGDKMLDLYMDVSRFSFGWEIHHASTVANIALDILEAVSAYVKISRQGYVDAYVAGLLHDIGRAKGAIDHHVEGARLVRDLSSVQEIARLDVVSKAVYHHRKRTDLLGDGELASMGEEARVIAAAVRAADAIKNAYMEDAVYSGVEAVGDELVVKGNMFKDFIEKSEPLRKLTGLKVVFRKDFWLL